MKNTNKGFTLVELLAVIVILAIIALIATPMVLGVIEKSKLRAAELSVFNYVDAIENQIMINMMEGDERIEDGFYDYNELTVSLKGETPDSGWVEIEEGQVSDYSLVVNGYVVTKGSTTKKGNTADNKKYALGKLIYFDPVSTDKCDKNSISETCYKWRVIETSDSRSKSTITLQMDHNIINKIKWAPDDNTTGPVIALTELNKKTETWSRVKALTYEYDTTASASEYGKMSCTDGACTLSGNAVEGIAKARLITGEEIRDITNTKVTDSSAKSKTWTLSTSMNDWFYFSRTDKKIGTQGVGTGNTDLAWLMENTSAYAESGATSNETENSGYWTLSPVSDHSSLAWGVTRDGRLTVSTVGVDWNFGMRPVITILKSNI